MVEKKPEKPSVKSFVYRISTGNKRLAVKSLEKGQVLFPVPNESFNLKAGKGLVGGIGIPVGEMSPSAKISQDIQRLPKNINKETFLSLMSGGKMNELPEYMRTILSQRTDEKGVMKPIHRDELQKLFNHIDVLEILQRHDLKGNSVKLESIKTKRYITTPEPSKELVDSIPKMQKLRNKILALKITKGGAIVTLITGSALATAYTLDYAGVIHMPEFHPLRQVGEWMFGQVKSPIPHDSGTGGIGGEGVPPAPGGSTGIGGEQGGAPSGGGSPAWYERAGSAIKDFFTGAPDRMRQGEFPFKGAVAIALGGTELAGSRFKRFNIKETEKEHGKILYRILKESYDNGVESMLKPGSPLLKDKAALTTLNSHVRSAFDKGELFGYVARVKLKKLPKLVRERYAKHITKGPFGGEYMDMFIYGLPEQQFAVGKGREVSKPPLKPVPKKKAIAP